MCTCTPQTHIEEYKGGVPLWLQMLQATGALKYNKNNISGH